jgi:hypothetical protein
MTRLLGTLFKSVFTYLPEKKEAITFEENINNFLYKSTSSSLPEYHSAGELPAAIKGFIE